MVNKSHRKSTIYKYSPWRGAINPLSLVLVICKLLLASLVCQRTHQYKNNKTAPSATSTSTAHHHHITSTSSECLSPTKKKNRERAKINPSPPRNAHIHSILLFTQERARTTSTSRSSAIYYIWARNACNIIYMASYTHRHRTSCAWVVAARV